MDTGWGYLKLMTNTGSGLMEVKTLSGEKAIFSINFRIYSSEPQQTNIRWTNFATAHFTYLILFTSVCYQAFFFYFLNICHTLLAEISSSRSVMTCLIFMVCVCFSYWAGEEIGTPGSHGLFIPGINLTASWDPADFEMLNKFICESDALIRAK